MKISKKEKTERIEKVYSLFYLEKKSIKEIQNELKISGKTVYRYLETIRFKNSLTKPQ